MPSPPAPMTSSPGDPQAASVELDVAAIRLGVTCGSELRDSRGVLLVGQGTRITRSVIDGLLRRGIDRLWVSPQMVAQLSRPASAAIAKAESPEKPNMAAAQTRNPADWVRGVPLKSNLVNCHHLPLDPQRQRLIRQNITAARDHFTTLQAQWTAGQPGTAAAVADLTAAFASRICEDLDHAIGEVVGDLTVTSSTDRAVQLATLGMAVATELDFDGPSVLQLGLAGLLHDVGQYRMDPSLWSPFRPPLDGEQMWQYRKHPIVSRQALQTMGDLPPAVLQVVEQIHEQIGGGGYPYGLTGGRIHPHARVLGVCDTYLRLIAGTSFCCPLLPHDAMGLILHLGGRGVLEPDSVRALLRIESLYPIGSRVRLHDGRTASVIRRAACGYARPVVIADDGERIDTATVDQPIKAQPIAASPGDGSRGAFRLTPARMQSLDWNPADDLIL